RCARSPGGIASATSISAMSGARSRTTTRRSSTMATSTSSRSSGSFATKGSTASSSPTIRPNSPALPPGTPAWPMRSATCGRWSTPRRRSDRRAAERPPEAKTRGAAGAAAQEEDHHEEAPCRHPGRPYSPGPCLGRRCRDHRHLLGPAAAADQIIKDYEAKHPDVTVKFVPVSSTETDESKLMTAVRGGVGPDIYYLNRFATLQRASEGVLENLKPYLDKEGVDLSKSYLPYAWGDVSDKNGVYALPF